MHVQRKFWKPHGKTSLCWGFYCVNDNANAQIMCCILWDKKISNYNKYKNTSKKIIIFLLQNKWNNFYSKKVDGDHMFIAKKFENKNEPCNETNKENKTY